MVHHLEFSQVIGVPQIIRFWTFLVLKPMVFEWFWGSHSRNPPFLPIMPVDSVGESCDAECWMTIGDLHGSGFLAGLGSPYFWTIFFINFVQCWDPTKHIFKDNIWTTLFGSLRFWDNSMSPQTPLSCDASLPLRELQMLLGVQPEPFGLWRKHFSAVFISVYIFFIFFLLKWK